MISQKIDDRYYVLNDFENGSGNFHDVMKLEGYNNRWVCDCEDWIYNKKMGTLGDCKHIREILK